jgi:ferritin-like metal-binding protein YciE
MPISNPRDKFIHELADMYDAEHQFLEAQQKMLDQATDDKLRKLLETHIEETQQQISNLEQVFEAAGEQPQRQTCSGAKGLIEEATKTMQEAGSDEMRDAFIVGAATKAEHYEMVGYADLIEGATMLKMKAAAVKLLTQNREQEVRTARKLERQAPRVAKLAA